MDDLEILRGEIDGIDRRMAELFCARMGVAARIAAYKAEHSLPVFDASREREIEGRFALLINDAELLPYCADFQRGVISVSRSYQERLISRKSTDTRGVRRLSVRSSRGAYEVIIGRGELSHAAEHFDLDRKVLILTDDGVPSEYSLSVARQCREPHVHIIPHGEGSKSLERFGEILDLMAERHFGRGDCIVAVGGGVVGDLAGFAAASYMRGIDFYNVPTTLLAQVDSSIGGKVAIDLGSYKNTVGAFYPPRSVIIDAEVLLTLDAENIRCGLAEALKMAVTSDAELFSLFETGAFLDDIEGVIERALLIKRGIVERDEREGGERRILNFGHTVGHAIESATGSPHGLCVAVGMLYACSDEVRERLLPIYEAIGLPTGTDASPEELYEYILLDKKADGDEINFVFANEIGSAEIKRLPIKDMRDILSLSKR